MNQQMKQGSLQATFYPWQPAGSRYRVWIYDKGWDDIRLWPALGDIIWGGDVCGTHFADLKELAFVIACVENNLPPHYIAGKDRFKAHVGTLNIVVDNQDGLDFLMDLHECLLKLVTEEQMYSNGKLVNFSKS